MIYYSPAVWRTCDSPNASSYRLCWSLPVNWLALAKTYHHDIATVNSEFILVHNKPVWNSVREIDPANQPKAEGTHATSCSSSNLHLWCASQNLCLVTQSLVLRILIMNISILSFRLQVIIQPQSSLCHRNELFLRITLAPSAAHLKVPAPWPGCPGYPASRKIVTKHLATRHPRLLFSRLSRLW